MAGGKGERFWPLSRAKRPKQFLKLTSDKTMLEETIDRIKPLIPFENIRIVAGESMTEHIMTSLPGVTKQNVLTEPFGRDTCLAIGFAAIHLVQEDPEAVMVVLSADHLIRPPEKLVQILRDGAALATREERLITIGITPTRPETAYGYIKLGEPFVKTGETTIFAVSQFAEKPKAAVAQEYYFSRQYLWNSGMFIWSAKAILNAIATCLPDAHRQLIEYSKAIGTPNELNARKVLYDSASAISIDYAVLEKASNVLVMKGDIIWDDVGSWNSLERYKDRDSENNVLIGDSVVLETFETTVYNDAEGIIACIGLSDLVVVRSENITLVAHKTKASQVKELLAVLGKRNEWKKYL
ncbi:MAG: mannose-1-phosphate guanylyltransferase [bacterium]|nr:mannose-1-phosphate guanylyltransferase [bacterium]